MADLEPQRPELARLIQATVHLPWHNPRHVADTEAPCRIGGGLTFVRDEKGRPCCLPCAEQELAEEYVRSHNALIVDERTIAPVPPPGPRPRRGDRR